MSSGKPSTSWRSTAPHPGGASSDEQVTGSTSSPPRSPWPRARACRLTQSQVRWTARPSNADQRRGSGPRLRPEPGNGGRGPWPPAGAPVDTHIFSGAKVRPYYDSLMARRSIAHGGPTGGRAGPAREALAEAHIGAWASNIASRPRSWRTLSPGRRGGHRLPAAIDGQTGACPWLRSSSSKPRCATATRASGPRSASTRPAP